MPDREPSESMSPPSTPETSPPPASANIERKIEHLKRKRRQLSPETLMPFEKDSKHLIDTVLIYEVELNRLRAQIEDMMPEIKRLEALKEPESQFRGLGLELKSIYPAEFLQDKGRVFAERYRKLKNETNILKSNVVVLGGLAKLMWIMTMTMVRDTDQDVEVLGNNVATLGAVAQEISNMTLLMGRDSTVV